MGWLQLSTAAMIGVFALAGTVVGAHLTLRNQLRVATLQNRQRAYAEIMGRRALLMQLFVSCVEARVHSDFHEHLWRIAGHPKESVDLDEAKRWMHSSEELVLDIARTKQLLFESIGTARASFPRSRTLDQLTERIYHFGSPAVRPCPQPDNAQSLSEWKDGAVRELQSLVEREYGKPLEELAQCLEDQLHGKAS